MTRIKTRHKMLMAKNGFHPSTTCHLLLLLLLLPPPTTLNLTPYKLLWLWCAFCRLCLAILLLQS